MVLFPSPLVIFGTIRKNSYLSAKKERLYIFRKEKQPVIL